MSVTPIKFKVIKSFKDVILDLTTSKPLVICDIDHTFIRCEFTLQHFKDILETDLDKFNSENEVVLDPTVDDKEAIELMNSAYNMGFVKQTDPDGFSELLLNVENMGGKLIFLTARGQESHKTTLKHLKKAGLKNADNFEIHYTGNECTKGEYIKKNNLLEGYNHFTFMDDYPSYIASVKDLHPQINCYLFRYD